MELTVSLYADQVPHLDFFEGHISIPKRTVFSSDCTSVLVLKKV